MSGIVVKSRMTEEEFLHLSDDGRHYEFVDGEAKEVPTKFWHDQIAFNLLLLLAPFVKGRGGVSTGQAGFRMRGGNIRCPDVSFTRKERLPEGRAPNDFGGVAPDFCVEIISESEDPTDMQRKLEEYFASGASLVWQIFPTRPK